MISIVPTENGYIVTISEKTGEQKNYVALGPQDVIEIVREQIMKTKLSKSRSSKGREIKVENGNDEE